MLGSNALIPSISLFQREFPIKQIKMRNHAIFVYRNYGLKYLEKRPDVGMVALGKRSVW